MEFIDSHTHPHFDNYEEDRPEVLKRSSRAGVTRIIAVGCSLADSQKAVNFAQRYNGVWATVGAHPNDGQDFLEDNGSIDTMRQLAKEPKVVAVGEIGLDYYRNITPKKHQHKLLRQQLQLGVELSLPFVFHVREAWDDFWPILDDYPGIKGVIHSFSAGPAQLNEVLKRGLFVGLNGLITYTKEDSWLDSAKRVPSDKLILETDAPFLTPSPERGKRCEPRHVAVTAQYLADLRNEELGVLAETTTKNCLSLFALGQERLD